VTFVAPDGNQQEIKEELRREKAEEWAELIQKGYLQREKEWRAIQDSKQI
jgi:hypothetical protein